MRNPPNTTVRLARLEDVHAITSIYNQDIEERNATFETEPRTVEQVTAQLAKKGERYPTVVVERDGQMVTWASAGRYQSRPCLCGHCGALRVCRAQGAAQGQAVWPSYTSIAYERAYCCLITGFSGGE
jgi:hypothetical protein